MGFHPTCYVCGDPRPIVDEDAKDNSRYGPCMSEKCERLRAKPVPEFPLFNIRKLKNQNAEGITASGMEKEIVESAKREGRPIERAPKN